MTTTKTTTRTTRIQLIDELIDHLIYANLLLEDGRDVAYDALLAGVRDAPDCLTDSLFEAYCEACVLRDTRGMEVGDKYALVRGWHGLAPGDVVTVKGFSHSQTPEGGVLPLVELAFNETSRYAHIDSFAGRDPVFIRLEAE